MKKGYTGNLENMALANNHFREVLYTATSCQLVLMSLKPGEEIGNEVHSEGDQFFRFEKGQGKAILNNSEEYPIQDGTCLIVPAGTWHNIINTSSYEALKMYTVYAPPHHRDGVIHDTKNIAEADTEEFDGKTTE